MLEYMKRVVLFGSELNTEERNLLSVAYKNSVGSRRYLSLRQDRLESPDLNSVERGVQGQQEPKAVEGV